MFSVEDICDGRRYFWLLYVVSLSFRAVEVERWLGGVVCFGGDGMFRVFSGDWMWGGER